MHVPFLKCFKRDKTEFLKYLQVPGSRISLQCITCPRGSDINTFELREQNHALDVSFSSRKLFYRSVEFGLTRVFQLRNKPFGSLFFVLMHDNFFFFAFLFTVFSYETSLFVHFFGRTAAGKTLSLPFLMPHRAQLIRQSTAISAIQDFLVKRDCEKRLL